MNLDISSPQVQRALSKLNKSEISYLLADLEGYSAPLVDINQFIDDKEYLGGILKNEHGKSKLYKIWISALNEIFPNPYVSPYCEVAFSGSIGAGKSTVGRIVLMYDLYKLIMLSNPFSKYELISSDSIVLALFTANLNLAKLVLYQPFRELIKASPFFSQRLLNKRKTREGTAIEFPNNVSIQGGSRFTHALGLAVFSGILDEASFQNDSENNNQAYESYVSMSRRMKSRFMESGGGIPGHLVLISSKKDENAFLEKHIETNKNDPSFKVYDYPLWEAHKDKGIYSGQTFKVFVGTALQSPRILEDHNNKTKYPADKLLDVPVEYQKEFKTNLPKALMDIAGTGTITGAKYITFPENITKSVRIVHCCNVADSIILDFFDDKRIIEYVDVQKLKLYLNLLGNSPRYVHVDIGITGDSYGFAMSAVAGMRDVERFDVDEIISNDGSTGIIMRAEPIIRTELALSLKSNTRVPLFKVRDLIMDLTDIGFPIVKVTADQFQSEDTLQLMTKAGYETEVISLDKTKAPHLMFRNAMYEGRVELPDFPLLVTELTELTDTGKKFDHPTGGCFIGDTEINILGGLAVPIADLINNYKGKYVYSFDGEEIVAGEIVNAILTKYVDTLVEVVLDNGKKIRCTPDHLFMLRNGSYREAQDLRFDESLMPLFRNAESFAKYTYMYLVKSVNIVKLDEPVPVYDITVNTYHNFALAAGIFVHNSKDISDAVIGSQYAAFQASGSLIDIT